jgi:hypothetical protein
MQRIRLFMLLSHSLPPYNPTFYMAPNWRTSMLSATSNNCCPKTRLNVKQIKRLRDCD